MFVAHAYCFDVAALRMGLQLMDQLSTVAEEATSLKAQDDDALEDEDGIPTARTSML